MLAVTNEIKWNVLVFQKNVIYFTAAMILCAAFCGYVLASLLLFRYPTILHKKKNLAFVCRHISHRGGAAEMYENTIAAFKRATQLGTDMLELDCHLTADGLVVVSHDGNLLRSTGVDRDISEVVYQDLPYLKEELPIDFEPGKTYKGSGDLKERKIPLLSEVFRQFPTMPINIDIKRDDDKLIREVSRLVRDYQRERLTVWGNINNRIVLKCYQENPNINLLFSLQRVVQLVLMFYIGLLPFVPIKESNLEIFLPSIYMRKDMKPRLPLHSLFVRTMNFLLMRRCLFEHLRRRGIQTYVWVLNYEEEFETAFQLGVTGVMTDYPSKLREFLDNHPEYAIVV